MIGWIGGIFDVMCVDFDVGVINVIYDGCVLGDGCFFVCMIDMSDLWIVEVSDWDCCVLLDVLCVCVWIGLVYVDWLVDLFICIVEGLMFCFEWLSVFVVCGFGFDDYFFVDLMVGCIEFLLLCGEV